MARHDPHGKEDLGERFSQFASVCGITDGHDLRSANDTPALNALKALRGAPISMGRGEIPVGGCQPPSDPTPALRHTGGKPGAKVLSVESRLHWHPAPDL